MLKDVLYKYTYIYYVVLLIENCKKKIIKKIFFTVLSK